MKLFKFSIQSERFSQWIFGVSYSGKLKCSMEILCMEIEQNYHVFVYYYNEWQGLRGCFPLLSNLNVSFNGVQNGEFMVIPELKLEIFRS